ncbi:MAG: hypothetical protein FJW26_05700 [Acidimicrobiia bacterium]|nr:hypothetical protein [Acidimicrobiia bacterium]
MERCAARCVTVRERWCLELSSPQRTSAQALNNWNIGIQKNTRLTEKKVLEFRVDMINAFNHRQFSLAGDPKSGGGTIFQQDDNRNATTAGFPTATNTNSLDPTVFNGGSRLIMLGLKFIF